MNVTRSNFKMALLNAMQEKIEPINKVTPLRLYCSVFHLRGDLGNFSLSPCLRDSFSNISFASLYLGSSRTFSLAWFMKPANIIILTMAVARADPTRMIHPATVLGISRASPSSLPSIGKTNIAKTDTMAMRM